MNASLTLEDSQRKMPSLLSVTRRGRIFEVFYSDLGVGILIYLSLFYFLLSKPTAILLRILWLAIGKLCFILLISESRTQFQLLFDVWPYCVFVPIGQITVEFVARVTSQSTEEWWTLKFVLSRSNAGYFGPIYSPAIECNDILL